MWRPSTNFSYSNNDNTGFLSKDPNQYLYMDIEDAKAGNKKWLTYDEMRKEASGIKYDCFTDETCYGYGWDYDKEHYIPALKEYANLQFYNNDMGIVDFYDMFAHEASYGDFPDFEDDEWWDYSNTIVKEGETKYNYDDPITHTEEFETALYNALLEDDEVADEVANSSESYEYICEQTAWALCNDYDAILLRPNVIAPGYTINVNGNYYTIDADLLWDELRYFASPDEY